MSLAYTPPPNRAPAQTLEPNLPLIPPLVSATIPGDDVVTAVQNSTNFNSPTTSIQSNFTNSIQNSCHLCNNGMTDKVECLLIVGCSHIFHRHCIENHLASSNVCPICQQQCELSDLQKISFPTKQNKTRGKPRGAMARQYHTMSYSKNLFQDQNDTNVSEQVQVTPNHRNVSGSRPTNAQSMIDYNEINRMIENSVSNILRNLNINTNFPSENPLSHNLPPVIPHQQPNCSGNPSGNRDHNPHTSAHASQYSQNTTSSFSIQNDRITSIIQNWGLKFDGAPTSLTVDEFLYRVRTLTEDHFNGDFAVICKNFNILLSGKARDWFWRYRKQVENVNWDDFCDAIRYQYKDYKSTSDIREEIRNRKQRIGESFDIFYEAISAIMDRLPTPIGESELIEIVTRNLRPEIRQDLLYIPINSMPHLRRLVQMRESFLNEEHVRRNLASRNSNTIANRRQISEINSDTDLISSECCDDIDAIRQQDNVPCCWNCDQPGHYWEDCLQERSIFCYGCGAKKIYKPQCQKCIARKSKNFKGPFPPKDPI